MALVIVGVMMLVIEVGVFWMSIFCVEMEFFGLGRLELLLSSL